MKLLADVLLDAWVIVLTLACGILTDQFEDRVATGLRVVGSICGMMSVVWPALSLEIAAKTTGLPFICDSGRKPISPPFGFVVVLREVRCEFPEVFAGVDPILDDLDLLARFFVAVRLIVLQIAGLSGALIGDHNLCDVIGGLDEIEGGLVGFRSSSSTSASVTVMRELISLLISFSWVRLRRTSRFSPSRV